MLLRFILFQLLTSIPGMSYTIAKNSQKISFSDCRDLQELTKFSQVTVSSTSQLPTLNESEAKALAREEQRYWLSWSPSLGAWIEKGGKKTTVLVHEDVRDVDLNDLTLGFTSALAGLCLNLQGQVAIHANAVCLNGKAIAFVGPSGAGKSTLSTFCVQQGMGLLTDDVLMVTQDDLVLPGNPRLKLFPHTGEALQLNVSKTTSYKNFYDAQMLGTSEIREPVELKAVYLLNGGEIDEVIVSSVPATQAIFDLLNNSYAVREFSDVLPRLFDRYELLVQQIPVSTLSYPHKFDRLPQVYDALMDML